jgi:hypothetical protein
MMMVTLSRVPCGPITVGGFGLYQVPCNRQSATDGSLAESRGLPQPYRWKALMDLVELTAR